MILAGKLAPEGAWNAIDYRTIGMLFGLMVVSAAFVVSGLLCLCREPHRDAPREAAGVARHSGRVSRAFSPRSSPMTSWSSR